jgi:2-polyprenyl-6-methoxyphenol hydroxylase-like FAD-dependent oxidoreductase
VAGLETVIVGAGPTGAALALLLARRGLTVTLVEREAGFGRVFRGEGLMPSGVAALRQLPLDGAADGVPCRIVDEVAYYVDGEPLMTFPEPDRHTPDAIRVLSQEHLLRALVDRARQSPRFTFLEGFAVRRVERTDHGWRVVSDDRALEADLVVAADGRASIVRERAGLTLDRARERDPHNHDALWCSLPLPPWLEQRTVFYAFLARHSVGTMYPTATGELRLGWLFGKADAALRERHPLEEVARLAPPEIAAWLGTVRGEATEPAFFRVMLGVAQKWSLPGLLLLGDAAHPMNAIRAQGINLGLRDAIVAANHLAEPLLRGEGGALLAACEAIEAERRPEIEAAQRLQLEIAAVPAPLFSPWVRRWVMPPLVRLGIPARLQTRKERVLRYGLGQVTLADPA